jgi:uncharacterized protein (DUF362 family)
MSKIALVHTDDRVQGLMQALGLIELDTFAGKRILLKPNFNSADPTPGSTHPDLLRALIEWLQQHGATEVIVGDRSGMGITRRVMGEKGVFLLAQEMGFEVVVFDELPESGWVQVWPNASHWERGFAVPRLLNEVDAVVQLCNLKTHRFGGHFTISLKNSVGLLARMLPGKAHDYMRELHTSLHQREMIAEANTAYSPALIVVDGVEAFTEGGPESGKRVQSNVILAGTDRVAIDAAGVAILRHFGTTPEVSEGPVFSQAQIARAAELGLGAKSPEHVELVAPDRESGRYAEEIRSVLDAEGRKVA